MRESPFNSLIQPRPGRAIPRWCLALVCIAAPIVLARADDEAALAVYADASNFQTNGAFALAVENWEKFLAEHSDHELAPMAAHYLGVSHMQSEPVDLDAAVEAFKRALRDEDYDLREESMANLGWCYFASAGTGPDAIPSRLRRAIQAYEELIQEYPRSTYLDRAHYYCGEANYALGETSQAVKCYDTMLSLKDIRQSPLRCDAFYARGVAHEDLGNGALAAQSFDQLVSGCPNSDLIADVYLRIGDLKILDMDNKAAIDAFQDVLDLPSDLTLPSERAYALLRQGYALAQLNEPAAAAKRYEQLLQDHPDSEYTGVAMLSAGQSLYQLGDVAAAAEKFSKVRQSGTKQAATEAAHWLAQIRLSESSRDPEAAREAFKIADQQIQAGLDGEYATAVRLDAAEALTLIPERLADALPRFEEVYRESPDDAMAARALYNAAFTALQLSEHEQAQDLAEEFTEHFADDALLPDILFITAESKLVSGDAELASKAYQRLLDEDAYRDNDQRPFWVLRAASAFNAAKQFDEAIDLIDQELESLPQPSQRAEALMASGQAHLFKGEASEAAKRFTACREADPMWPRSEEAFLMAGQAQLSAGDEQSAKQIWNELIRADDRGRMAQQARYKLGQLATSQANYKDAVELFQLILGSDADPALKPFARYAMGFAQVQTKDYSGAIESLTSLVDQTPPHTLSGQARLMRGTAYRGREQLSQAASDIRGYLALEPKGLNLGDALYELALVYQDQNKPAEAAEELKRLVQEVPAYPNMDKVIYELGWSLRKMGAEEEAVEQFDRLIQEYPNNEMLPEAAYYLGQYHYDAGRFGPAADAFLITADKATALELKEKALYRMGWSHFKKADFPAAEATFVRQFRETAEGRLHLDSMMMVGESRFKQENYDTALRAYAKAREFIEAKNESSRTLRDATDRQVRELVYLHGGQSAAQLKQWDVAIDWYDELRERFPATNYLPQVFYETAFAHQQRGDLQRAIKLYTEVADKFRNVLAAQARFMMGEIYFEQRQFAKAIPEFQRVMFGFGAEKAPPDIKNWQARSGFEAGRCSELLVQNAQTADAKRRAAEFARRFYAYVVEKHPQHELRQQASTRLSALETQ
ncbi:MAG: tetratricopeptide repeat protein [Planctomycetota bacterium]